ncbi:alkylated DNA repair protein AlkB [Artemisia annua]|uniref:Alkylated DNA repair protein AlkB n=1 Tax=Artemisia annua TaxID=35608 RepID=A0A2U1N8T1_ARTAN|nr:alkylated DNA repair protein AlkB [Artemisia annua]
MENNVESSCEKLGCGFILLKNYITLTDQVEIVNLCQELGLGLHGFEERIPDGEKLGLHSMLLGPKWYSFGYPLNMVPDKILSLAKSSIQDSQPHLNLKDEISSMCPDHCIVKFYTNTAPLALHEEPDDWCSIKTKPVVSIFIGDTTEFFYGNSRNVNDEDKALLESGDVLILDRNFGDIFLGLHRIIPNSAPLPILKKCMLKPGLLNLSFREFREF